MEYTSTSLVKFSWRLTTSMPELCCFWLKCFTSSTLGVQRMDLLIKVVISAKFRLKPFFLFFFFCEHLQIFLRFPALFQKELRQINVYPALQVWNNSSPLSTSENCFLSEIHFFNGIPQQIMLDWAVYKMYTAIQLMWVFTVKFKRLS